MKKISDFIFSILLSVVPLFLISGVSANIELDSLPICEPPSELVFKKGLQLSWLNFTVDSFYFPTSDTIRTQYNERYIRSIVERGNYIYIIETTIYCRPGIDPDGFILRKLEQKTGKEIWAHHNTFFSGNEHHESFQSQSIMNFEGNSILIQGLRQAPFVDNDFPYWHIFPVNSNPIIYEISDETGELVKELVSSDTTTMALKVNYKFGFQNLVKNGSDYFYLYGGPNKKEEGVMILPLSDSLEIIDTTVFEQVLIEGPDDVPWGNIKPMQIRSLGDDRFAFLYSYVKDWGDIFGDDHLIQLAIVDLSDAMNPVVIKRLDLNEYLFQDYHVDGIFINEINGDILVQKKFFNGGIDQRWLLWVTRDGEIKSFIPKISLASDYYRNGFFATYVDDNQMIGYGPREGHQFIDILKFEAGDSIVTVLSTIELEDFDNRLVVFKGKIIDDQLVLGGWLATILGSSPESNQARFVFNLGIDIDKLGIDLSVATEELSNIEAAPIIYPNPSDGIFLLKNFETLDFEYLTITDLQCRIVASKIWREEIRYARIDLRALSNGNYFINYFDEKNIQVYQSSGIVKL